MNGGFRRGSRRALGLAIALGVAPASAADPPAGTAPAGELFQRAGEAFEAQQFALALELLQQACGQSDFEGCDFNLGAAHHALRHCAEARTHYAAYLKAHPDGARQAEARAALDALELRCGAGSSPPDGNQPESRGESATPPPLPAPSTAAAAPQVGPTATLSLAPPLPPSPPLSPPVPSAEPAARSNGTGRIVAVSLLGLGGTAGVATLLLALEVSSVNSAIEAHRSAPFDAAQQRRLDRADRFRSLTLGTGIATGLLLGSSAAVWWLAPSSSSGVALALGPELELRLRGRF